MAIRPEYMTYNEYTKASRIDQAWYNEYQGASDHKDGYWDGREDKENKAPKTVNKDIHSYGYVTGYNQGYYLARSEPHY